MKKSHLPGTFCACLFSFFISTANAVVVDLRSTPLTQAGNSLSFVVDGVSVTATGHHVEYNTGTGATTIYGPFTTATVESSPSFLWPGFGRTIELGFGGATTVVSGLGLQTSEDLGQTDRDLPTGALQAGLDNRIGTSGALPGIQFALFSFSAPVNVTQVIVDDNSNFGRAIWAAGGNTAPDLTQDFLTAFAGFDVRNSPDDLTDGFFTHTLTPPLQGIQFLAVGTPPDSILIGDLGPLTGGESNIGFFIEGLNVTQVPIPAAVWLFNSGLLGLLVISRRRRMA